MTRFDPRRLSPPLRLAALCIALVLAAFCGWLAYIQTAEPIVDVRGDGRPTIGAVYFGGPDRPPGALRAELLRRVRQSPPGSAIDWATYYFLDREIAEALIAASDRGVRVTLCVEGDPRLEGASDTVLAMLRRHGLRGGLTVRPRAPFPFEELSGKLHSKIYAFSWPRPAALVGSFNPSGSADAATLREIGDQDLGHNLLVEIVSPGLVGELVGRVHLLAANEGSAGRLWREDNRIVRDRDTQLYFYPRLRTEIVEDELDRLDHGDRLWAAVSHLKEETVGNLIDAAERGAILRLIVHDSERRVPQASIDRLVKAGIEVRRYHDRRALPMHAKFFLIERDGGWTAYFGSLNYNRNSRLLNDELLVKSSDPGLIAALRRRFDQIDRQVDAQPVAHRGD